MQQITLPNYETERLTKFLPFEEIRRYFERPGVQRKFEQWKKERELKQKEGEDTCQQH